MNKQAKKIIAKLEQDYRNTFNEKFIELMLKNVPFDENGNTDSNVPSRQQMLEMMNAELNKDNNMFMFGMLTSFVFEKYEAIKA